ncbi:MAG: hypothetical protein GXX80_08660 [Thermotogaceae bacterium]|nr:hypothetical protein [Thermotogaceae bacterium]
MSDERMRVCERIVLSMNEFYTLLFSIIDQLESEGIAYDYGFENKFNGLNPDASLKVATETGGKELHFFEYKDSGIAGNIVVEKQILKYGELDMRILKSSGQSLIKDGEFSGLLLVCRLIKEVGTTDLEEFKREIEILFDSCCDKFKADNRLSLIFLEVEDDLSLKTRVSRSSSTLVDNMNQDLEIRSFCLYILREKMLFKKASQPNLGLIPLNNVDFSRYNLAIFFASAIGFILRNRWRLTSFTVRDLVSFWHTKSLDIIDKTHKPSRDRTFEFFEEALSETFVKSKFLIEETSYAQKRRQYRIATVKRLENPRTMKALVKTLAQYLNEDKLINNLVRTLPLFSNID